MQCAKRIQDQSSQWNNILYDYVSEKKREKKQRFIIWKIHPRATQSSYKD
jgi:hypothetical protein